MKTVTLKRADNSIIQVRVGRSKELADSFTLGQAVNVPDIGSFPKNWPWEDEMPKSVDAEGNDAFKGCWADVQDAPPPPPPPLVEVKTSLKAQVDVRAEQIRLNYITAGDGQALEYREVADEAERYAVSPVGSFPLLQASVDSGEAVNLAAAAALVAARHAAWKTIGAAIRKTRLEAKIAIDAAADEAAARAIFDAVEWP